MIDAHVDADELDGIRDNVEAIQAEATERIEALKTEIEEQVAVENARLHELVAGIQLPRAPAVPEPELAERPRFRSDIERLAMGRWNASTQTPQVIRQRR